MKTLYLDLVSGISGDMFVGALIDLGVDIRKLERGLKKLELRGYHLRAARGEKSGIAGIKFDVLVEDGQSCREPRPVHYEMPFEHCSGETACGFHIHEPGPEPGHRHHHPRRATPKDHHHGERDFGDIRKLIARSRLSPWVKKKSIAVFQHLAAAEGKIHGLPSNRVHFHEVGAVDSIVDIVGGCLALELLGKPRVLASPVVEGVGWVDCAHGRFPVPAPATLAILGARGIGVTQCEEPHELVTPTGAALLAELAEAFGPMQGLVAEKIGFGLGTRENKTRPNALRAVLGESRVEGRGSRAKSEVRDWETDQVVVLETNLDDVSGEILGHFVDLALAAGALDVFHTPIQMKKHRPGVLLTVLCGTADADRFSELMLRETGTFGVRRTLAERRKLRREFARVKTRLGEVTVKIGRLGGKIVHAAPEFESCKRVATRAKVPLKSVYEAAIKALKING